MKKVATSVKTNRRRILLLILLIFAISFLMVYRLGTLVPGLSLRELSVLNTPMGWSGIFNHPFFLPLVLLRSIVLFIFNDPGNLLLRLPSTFIGILGILSFAYIIRRWHGVKTAIFATAMFATSAWTLHVSRLATFDVMYLSAIPILICSGLLLEKYAKKWFVFYGTVLVWSLMLYTPGLLLLLALTVYWYKDALFEGWKHFNNFGQRLLYILIPVFSLPLIAINLLRSNQLLLWIGAPAQFESPLVVAKHFAVIFLHLFIRGPKESDLWLGRAPILDIFTLVMLIIGAYFYIVHPKAFRSRQLLTLFIVSVVLVTLNGLVGLSLIIPLLYILAATGIAYLMHEWLKVFPLNPFARSAGIILISIAVFLSCLYNIRSYFIAWPHNNATDSAFRYKR